MANLLPGKYQITWLSYSGQIIQLYIRGKAVGKNRLQFIPPKVVHLVLARVFQMNVTMKLCYLCKKMLLWCYAMLAIYYHAVFIINIVF